MRIANLVAGPRARGLGKSFGFAEADRRDAVINAGFAISAAVGVALGFAALVWITTEIHRGALFGPRPAWVFDPPLFAANGFWRSDAVVAREYLSIYFAVAVVGAVTALIAVLAIIWREYSARLTAVIFVVSAAAASVIGNFITSTGATRDFLVRQLLTKASGDGFLPPGAWEALERQIDIATIFSFTAGYVTIAAAILFAMPGRDATEAAPALRRRWHMMLIIYVLAMLTVAMMTLGTRLIVDYAAAPLTPLHADNVADEPGQQEAAQRLGAILAGYAGIATTLILILACAPSFVSIRRTIQRAAEAQAADATVRKESQAQERAARQADDKKPLPTVALDIEVLSADEWITKHSLGMNWLKSVVAGVATLAPVLLPALAGIAGEIAKLVE